MSVCSATSRASRPTSGPPRPCVMGLCLFVSVSCSQQLYPIFGRGIGSGELLTDLQTHQVGYMNACMGEDGCKEVSRQSPT